MKRVLLLFYSQSGESERMARLFDQAFTSRGIDTKLVRIQPKADYPYPWGSISRFFDVMPETQLGQPPPIELPGLDPADRFDLAILVYPIWFLCPALPVQGFFRTAQAAALNGTPVMTVTVSRAMWQQGSEGMKRLLAGAGLIHIDNVVVTHQGSPVATLVSTPRTLLSGRRGQFMGVFPESGISAADRTRIARLAESAAKRLAALPAAPGGSLLAGEPAVTVKLWLIGPELVGWYCFHGWARFNRALGRPGLPLRRAGAWAFAVFLLLLILAGLPLVLIGTPILRLFAGGWLRRYAARLAAPSGEGSRSWQ
jgi:hypothetical protein